MILLYLVVYISLYILFKILVIRYYKQAYLSVLDIRFYDTNILEIKTVASIINYKLIAMQFEIKRPIDAIDQFRKHIDIFRIKVGSPELAFEHSAWLSKQFELMGELFEDAIRKGLLSAVQTQHPGKLLFERRSFQGSILKESIQLFVNFFCIHPFYRILFSLGCQSYYSASHKLQRLFK
jgi:hypothetical protein